MSDMVNVIVPSTVDVTDQQVELIAIEAIDRACDHRGLTRAGSPRLIWQGSWADAVAKADQDPRLQFVQTLPAVTDMQLRLYESSAA